MSLNISTAVVRFAAEAAEHTADPAVPFIAAGIAFAVFLTLGVVAWSYRDVANRTTRGRDTAGNGSAGHGSAGHDGHSGH